MSEVPKSTTAPSSPDASRESDFRQSPAHAARRSDSGDVETPLFLEESYRSRNLAENNIEYTITQTRRWPARVREQVTGISQGWPFSLVSLVDLGQKERESERETDDHERLGLSPERLRDAMNLVDELSRDGAYELDLVNFLRDYAFPTMSEIQGDGLI